MKLRRYAALLAMVCLGLSPAANAANPDSDWQSGRDAFARGDIAAALDYFEDARDNGMQGPAVHYNIAVCQYELGDYAVARETFALIASRFPKMRGLAEYNIALSSQRLGDVLEAQRQFIAAYQHSDDPKLKALAASQLRELDHENPSPWYGSIGVQAGHDNNVALRDSLGLPTGQTGESPMMDLFATLRAPLPGANGFALDGMFYAVSYADADEFDQAEMRLGIVHRWRPANWRIDSGVFATTGRLGGASFNQELNLDLRAIHYLDDAASFELRLRHDDVDEANTLFSGIDGTRTRIDLRYRWHRVPHFVSLRYGIESNDRADPGVSPSRQLLQGAYYLRLSDYWELETGVNYRSSEYDDLSQTRNEDQVSTTLGLSRTMDDDWILSLRYLYADNESTDPSFSYQRKRVVIGLQKLF